MEIQPFLADRCRGQDERPERRVERFSDLRLAMDSFGSVRPFINTVVAKRDRKMRRNADLALMVF
jgi:hypothetical protein